MKIDTYTEKGNKTTSVNLPKELSGEINLVLLAQAVRVYENKEHKGVSVVKGRSAVVASKRKIYRQKGTGRARHGALSAPIFVGGGKAHGPVGLKRELTLSKKLKKRALQSSLALKKSQNKLIVVTNLEGIKKTKEAVKLLTKISKSSQSKITLVLSEQNKKSVRYFKNIERVSVLPFSLLNAYHVYLSGTLILDKNALSEKRGLSVPKNTKSSKKTKSK